MNGYIKSQNYKNTHATIVCGLRITQFLIVGLVKYHYSILKSPGLARFGRKFQLLLRFLINTKKNQNFVLRPFNDHSYKNVYTVWVQ